VTGFQFKGRQGTAVVQGVIVAEEYAEAVEAVIQGFAEEVERDEDLIRTAECLRLWRRFALGLQIARRIGLTDVHDKDEEHVKKFREELDEVEDEAEETMEAGGFFPDEGADVHVQPTAHLFRHESPPEGMPADEPRQTRSTRAGKRKLVVDDAEDEEMAYNPTAMQDSDSARQEPEQAAATEPGSRSDVQDDIAAESHHHGTDGYVQGDDPASQALETAVHGDAIMLDDGIGGGFVVDSPPRQVDAGLHDEEMGGGFVPDEAPQTHAGYAQQHEHSDLGITEAGQAEKDSGGGFVLENEPSGEGDKSYQTVPSEEPLGPVTLESTPEPASEEGDIPSGVVQDEGSGNSDAGDRASLLSHDPDDDDADPEWL